MSTDDPFATSADILSENTPGVYLNDNEDDADDELPEMAPNTPTDSDGETSHNVCMDRADCSVVDELDQELLTAEIQIATPVSSPGFEGSSFIVQPIQLPTLPAGLVLGDPHEYIDKVFDSHGADRTSFVLALQRFRLTLVLASPLLLGDTAKPPSTRRRRIRRKHAGGRGHRCCDRPARTLCRPSARMARPSGAPTQARGGARGALRDIRSRVAERPHGSSLAAARTGWGGRRRARPARARDTARARPPGTVALRPLALCPAGTHPKV